ncbi:MAG: histidine phosphatase family protein, partial [Myxococcota bacterium]
MEIWFARHAQPAWEKDGAAVLDPVLTELGARQADSLADRISKLKRVPTRLWRSTTRRAEATARPIEAKLGIKAEVFDWLDEVRLPPHWEGRPAETLSKHFYEAKTRSVTDWWRGIADGESFDDFHRRVTIQLERKLADGGMTPRPTSIAPLWDGIDKKEVLLIVGHAGTNSVALGHLLGLRPVPWQWERMGLKHASLSRLRAVPIADGFIFGLSEHSDVAHLPEDDR